VVTSSAYFAITKRNGSFEIPGVPPGQYDVTVFHERASEAALRELNRKITVGEGGLTLPPIGISEAGYLSIPHTNKYGHAYPPDPNDQAGYSTKK